MLSNAKQILPTHHMIKLYFAHIYSHMTYGISVWGPHLNNTQINKICSEQKKALRHCYKQTYNIDYNSLFKTSKILMVGDIIKVQISKVAHKLNNNSLPPNNAIFFNTNQMTHQYNTRNRNYARAHQHRTQLFNKSLFNKAIAEWSKLPASVKGIPNLKPFVKKITDNIIDKY